MFACAHTLMFSKQRLISNRLTDDTVVVLTDKAKKRGNSYE